MEHVSTPKFLKIKLFHIWSFFRLHGIMTNLFRNTAPRGKRTVESGKEVAKIWDDDRSICFAGRKLPFRVPDGDRNMEILREALNTFIVLLSHIRGEFFDLV